MAMENAERTVHIATIVLHSDFASSSGVACSTQTIVNNSIGAADVPG